MLSSREERQEFIVGQLACARFATVGELAHDAGYSVATIKRDLAKLEQQGFVRRTRGGAVPVAQNKVDMPYFMKMASMGVERNKDILAGMAQHLLRDDMTIILDSSTTCLHMIRYLARYQGVHVITNGVVTAAMLSERTSAEVCVLGGVVSTRHQTINGAKAYNDMLAYTADLAILSCRGFDVGGGASEISEGEAIIKQAMRRQATEVILLVGEEKIGRRFVYQSLRCTDIDCLATDAELDGADLAQLGSSNIEVLTPSGSR